jgi:hypothetical protein
MSPQKLHTFKLTLKTKVACSELHICFSRYTRAQSLVSNDPPLPLDATNIEYGCPITKQSVPNYAKTEAVTADQRGIRIQFHTTSPRCFDFFWMGGGALEANPNKSHSCTRHRRPTGLLGFTTSSFLLACAAIWVYGQSAGSLHVK